MSETPVQPQAPEGDDLMALADAIHDEDPGRALAMLRAVDAATLSAARRMRLAFLLNHVLGEKFGLWREALDGQRTLVELAGADAPPVLLRQAAICAQAAGDDAQAAAWTQALATATGALAGHARALVSLGVVAFSAPTQDAETSGRLALQVLRPLAALHAPPGSGLDAAFGAVTNILASDLVERPLGDLEQPDLRTALELAAEHAQRFWQRAGQWVNVERAHYLRAMAANALGQGALAVGQARAGLALLDEHDAARAEDVDRAFLELELAQGLRLAEQPGGAEAIGRAQALAADFGDAALDKWFVDRLRRNEALRAHYQGG